MIGIDPGCVKTLGVIRAVRKRPEFHAPVRNLGQLNNQANTDFTYARLLQRSVWVFTQPGPIADAREGQPRSDAVSTDSAMEQWPASHQMVFN